MSSKYTGHTLPVLTCNRRRAGASEDAQTNPPQPRHTSHQGITSAARWPVPKCPCFHSIQLFMSMKSACLIFGWSWEAGGEDQVTCQIPVLPKRDYVGHTLTNKISGCRDLLHSLGTWKNILFSINVWSFVSCSCGMELKYSIWPFSAGLAFLNIILPWP